MSKHSCLIIEDDKAFSEILESIVAKVPEVEMIGISDNTVDAAKRLELDKPDILLLDVNISGLEGPEILEVTDHQPKTIVITSHGEEVMENYDIEYVAFIQKPLRSADQLVNAIYECINEL
ncbi:MAG: response regulator [Cyclobacteriaceae bacterium]